MERPGFNEEESPLSRLAARRGRDRTAYLAEAEAAAGERLRIDFTRAGLSPRISQSWERVPRSNVRGGAGEISDHALDAKARLERALGAVGPELSGLLLDVCCFLKGLETVERERSWPARSAKLMLKTGLAILARHYGTASGTGAARMRRWGTADSRPRVGG